MPDDIPKLRADNLEKYFPLDEGLLDRILGRESRWVNAVDGVSISLRENDVVGVIGESGCGKSTLLLTMLGLYEPTGGDIFYNGNPFAEFDRHDWKDFRRHVQPIFQDPYDSLNPKMTVEDVLVEPLQIHDIDEKPERIREALTKAELIPPERYLGSLPAELSGGERQRVSIARALVLEPDVLLADEPVSMLDVSTQASILNLLDGLVSDEGLAMMYISHDLSTVGHLCDTINVMYLGRIVERADVHDLVSDPKHPYTQALVNAVPIPDPYHERTRTTLRGAPSDPIDVGEGCRFRDRCPEIIPPESMEISNSHFREINDLRTQVAERELGREELREVVDRNRDSAEEMTTEETVSALYEHFFDEELRGEHRRRVETALGHLLEEDRDRAADVLSEYVSICETTPEFVRVDGDRHTSCHLYYTHAPADGHDSGGEVQ